MREIERCVGVPKTTIRRTLLKSGVAIRDFSNGQKYKSALFGAMGPGATPYGYAYLEGKLVIDPREYKTVLEILRLWQSVQSTRAIARILNERKLFTRQQKRWHHVAVRKIIERELQLQKSGGKNGT